MRTEIVLILPRNILMEIRLRFMRMHLHSLNLILTFFLLQFLIFGKISQDFLLETLIEYDLARMTEFFSKMENLFEHSSNILLVLIRVNTMLGFA